MVCSEVLERARRGSTSAGRLHVVVVQAGAEGCRQRAADDDDARREAVVTPIEDVPDEHGGGERGQQAGCDVHVAGVGELGVRPDAVERH